MFEEKGHKGRPEIAASACSQHNADRGRGKCAVKCDASFNTRGEDVSEIGHETPPRLVLKEEAFLADEIVIAKPRCDRLSHMTGQCGASATAHLALSGNAISFRNGP